MIRDERGSMSAFLAMLFLVFLLLISLCAEGIYMYTAKGKAMAVYMSGLSHTKGNYQKEFADMYHIYAMDPRYKKKVETDFSDRMKESLDNAEDSFSFRTGNAKLSDEVDLTAQNGEVLKYQIRQQMKYEMGSDLLKTWTNNIRTSTDLQKKITDIKGQISKDEKEAQRQQENTKNDQKDEKKDKEEIKPSAKKDPRKGFMKLLKEGSVSLVMGKKKVSDLPIDIVYGKEDTTKQKIWNFMNRKTMEKRWTS